MILKVILKLVGRKLCVTSQADLIIKKIRCEILHSNIFLNLTIYVKVGSIRFNLIKKKPSQTGLFLKVWFKEN